MFSFMKKDKEHKKEKDEKKKEKKDKKEREKKEKHKEQTTQEELNRLEEVKKGIFRRKSDREKRKPASSPDDDDGGFAVRESFSSGSSTSLASGDRPSPGREHPHENGKQPPKLLPKPAVKSILKSKGSGHVSENLDDSTVLKANTYRNMEMSGKPINSEPGSKPKPAPRSTAGMSKDRPPEFQPPPPPDTPPPEKAYAASFKLPEIVPAKPPRVRELVIKRTKAGDFGFTLRKATTTIKGSGDTPDVKQTIIFAEPGAGQKTTQTGLIPGDRLVEVNGVNVEQTSREEIVDMIRKTGDTVTLKVQPIPELIELSVRPSVDGSLVDVEEEVVKGGTLRRSGSMRYKKPVRFYKTSVTGLLIKWLQSLKQFFINISYHILVASLTLMALF